MKFSDYDIVPFENLFYVFRSGDYTLTINEDGTEDIDCDSCIMSTGSYADARMYLEDYVSQIEKE